MDADRLKALADCYGADPQRWPEGERASALAFIAADRLTADRILFEARQMDAVLDLAPSPVVSHDLRERVIARAAAQGLRPRSRARFSFDPLTWFSGAGVAAACAAGVLVGVNATSIATADERADAVLYQASLAGVDDLEVLG